MWPWRGPGRLWDRTWWLLGSGWSLTHLGTGIILPYQLIPTMHTKTPALAPHLPIWASLLAGGGAAAPPAHSQGDWSSTKLLKAPSGAAAGSDPSTQLQPGHLPTTG